MISPHMYASVFFFKLIIKLNIFFNFTNQRDKYIFKYNNVDGIR